MTLMCFCACHNLNLSMLHVFAYGRHTGSHGVLQVEVQGSGYAQSRVGYEAFRLHYYKTDQWGLGWGRLVVELLFVLLTFASFASDLSPVIFRRNAFVKQDQNWWQCALHHPPALRHGCKAHRSCCLCTAWC